MKKRYGKLIAMLLTMAMVLSQSSMTVFADIGGIELEKVYTAKYLDTMTDQAQSVKFSYSDAMLDGYSIDFSPMLAVASEALALSAGNTTDDNIKSLLGDMGFDHFASNYKTKVEKNDNVCVSYAMKSYGDNVIVPVVVRGSHYEVEWIDNFYAGTEGNAAGYSTAADKVVGYVNKYIADNNIDAAKVKLWIVGYSRGGAIADLACKALSGTYGEENVYGYCFESPMTYYGTGGMINVHHTRNVNDGVTCVLPAFMGWNLAGNIDNEIGTGDASNMMANLKSITTDYDKYVSSGFTYASFDAEDVLTSLLSGDDIAIEPVKGSPVEMGDFWAVVMDKLKTIVPDRATYTSVYSKLVTDSAGILGVEVYSIEDAAREIAKFIFSLDDNKKAEIADNLDAFMAETKTQPLIFLANHPGILPVIVGLASKEEISLNKNSYASLVKDIATILGADSNLKAAINGALDPLLKFADKDLEDSDYQVIGTVVYEGNIDRIIGQHALEIAMAWTCANYGIAVGNNAELDIGLTPHNETTMSDEELAEWIAENPLVVGKLTAAKKALTVKWPRISQAGGYRIQLSTSKKFTKKTTKTYNVKKSTVKKTVKKLKSKKKYYVRAKYYVKNSKGEKLWSAWSKTMTKKVK